MKSSVKYSNIKQILDKNGLSTDLAKDDSVVERKTMYLDPITADAPIDQHKAVAMISTIHVDSDGDIMIPSGFNFSLFTSNPIVCWNHDYSLTPIGKAVQIEVLETGVRAEMEIETVTKFGCDVWNLVRGGFIKACSVGFIALETLTRKDAGFKSMLDSIVSRYGIDVSGCLRIVTRCLLMENSLVTLPGNSNALIFGTKSLNINEETIKKLHLELKEEKTDEPADKASDQVITAPIPEPEKKAEEIKPEVIIAPEPVLFVNIIGHIPTDEEIENQKKQLKAKINRKLFI